MAKERNNEVNIIVNGMEKEKRKLSPFINTTSGAGCESRVSSSEAN